VNDCWCINLHKVPVEFRIFAHFALLVSFAPSISIPNGLPRSFGAESYSASPSKVVKRLGVLPCMGVLPHINRPGRVRPPTGKPINEGARIDLLCKNLPQLAPDICGPFAAIRNPLCLGTLLKRTQQTGTDYLNAR